MKRREFLKVSAIGAAVAAVASPAVAQWSPAIKSAQPSKMTRPAEPFFATEDGTTIFYKDWGPQDAQPICFHTAVIEEALPYGYQSSCNMPR